jgi:predicted NAD/FAD-binding protein
MGKPRRVAVVGGGIAGMSAAYHLAKHSKEPLEVTLLEREAVMGGHEMSVETKFGRIDLGFMVLNRETVRNERERERTRGRVDRLLLGVTHWTHVIKIRLLL